SWSMFAPSGVPTGTNLIFAAPFLIVPPSPPPAASRIATYDTRLTFTDSVAWSGFDLKQITNEEAYVGCGTDGHYVYLVPRADSTGVTKDGLVARYDITQKLDSPSSWET